MGVFERPVYWTTDLGRFEASGFSGEKGADGRPYRLVLVRQRHGDEWREFDQVRLDRARNPDVEFERWRYRVTGYPITPECQTLHPSLASLPVTGCGHAYFPSPDGVGEVVLINGDRVCAPCSDAQDREAMRHPGPRARFEFLLHETAKPLWMRVTTPLGGLVGLATVNDIQTRTNPGGATWVWRKYVMSDVFGRRWEGGASAASDRVKFKPVAPE